jgi:hypothetical protein
MLQFFADYIASEGFVGLYGSLVLIAGATVFVVNLAAAFVGVPRHARAALIRPQLFGFVLVCSLVLAPLGAWLYWRSLKALKADVAMRWGFAR